MTLLTPFRVNRKKAKSKPRALPVHAGFTVIRPGCNKKVLDSADALLYLSPAFLCAEQICSGEVQYATEAG